MSYDDFIFGDRLMEQRVKEEHRQAEVRRLQREAMAGRQGWLSQQRGWVLCQVGRWLESLGQRLQQYGLPQTSSLEGQIDAGM